MAEQLKELLETRAGVWHEMRSILEATESNGMNGEESEKYDRLEAEHARLDKDINARRRASQIEERMNAPRPTPDLELAAPPATDEARAYRKAFTKYLRGQQMTAEDNRVLQTRAMGENLGAGGGYLVPEQFSNQIYEVMKWFGSMRQVAGSITTSTGGDLLYPNVDDTGNVGEIIDENSAFNLQDVNVGARTFKAWMYSSKIVKVSWQLMQDSAIDLEALLSRLLGTRIGRIQNTHFTTGTGAGQPEGITTNASTVAATATTTIAFEDIINLIYGVDRAYRVNGEFMMNDGIISALRQVRTDVGGANTGQFLWQPSLVAGEPDRLWGYPVVPNNDMQATVVASTKTVLFGDFTEGYLIRDVREITLVRLNELYAGSGQVGFLAFARSDGQPRFPGSTSTPPYKALIQHS